MNTKSDLFDAISCASMTNQPQYHDILRERGSGVLYCAGNIFNRGPLKIYGNDCVFTPKFKKKYYCK